MARVLLIIPPCFSNRELDFEIGFPINLTILGQSVRVEGWDVEYLDMTLEEKEGYDSFAELDRRLLESEIKLVGISNHTVRTSVTTRVVAERIKLLRPDVRVVVGGVYATFMTRELLESCSAIDYVLRGYAQQGIRALLRSQLGEILLPVPGLAQLQNGTLCEQPLARVMPADFDAPSFRDLDVSRYLPWTRTYPLLTHTGCGFSCNFCTSVMPGPYQSKEVFRAIENVITEMKRGLDLGFERFFMSDNIFTSHRDYCLELCLAMKDSGIADRATWICMTRVEFVDEELLGEMEEAGCVNIAFGVETAGVEQWKSLHKGRFSEEVVHTAFRLATHVGIGTTAYLMLGSPSQTQSDIDATAHLIREIDPDYRVISFFQPFPGTPYWETPEKFGLSEIAPLEEWNFHEAPICRTSHLSKPQLQDAAMRLYLERDKLSSLQLSNDRIELGKIDEDREDSNSVVRDIIGWADQRLTIRELLEKIGAKHGNRGRLIALYWLSSALRDGLAKIAGRTETAPQVAGLGLAFNALTDQPRGALI